MPMISAKEAGAVLGLSPGKVYGLAQQGKLPCHRYGPRAVRFEMADVEDFKKSCRSVSTPATNVGAISLTEKLQEPGSALADYFQKAGVKPRRKNTTGLNRRGSTPLRLVSKSLSG